MGTQLRFSTAFHPQTDGQSERTIQTLEDMLRACVLDFTNEWERYLPLVEFSYNNSYHTSIGMAPYEALYGRPCRSPICWNDVGERVFLGPQNVQDCAEKVAMIRKILLSAQDRQKGYADKRRKELSFEIGDHVFLKISPSKGIMRFGIKGKLSPRYIGPFEILERIGAVAYKLALPPSYAGIHDVFHVSMLKKYVHDPTHVIRHEGIEVQLDASMIEKPLKILDRKEQILRNKVIPKVLIQWQHHKGPEATWEREDTMRQSYPELFEMM
jgi:hypothetical protein